MLPISVHPATTAAVASRPRLSPPKPSTSSSSYPRLVHLKRRRLPLRSLRSLAAAAADAVEAEESYGGDGEEEKLGGDGEEEKPGGDGDSLSDEEGEEVLPY